MYNYKIIVEYDGGNFVGWQQQENGQSIQGALQEAVFKLAGEKVTIFGAGRTDAGVHAYGQVASFSINKKISTDVIRDGLNQHLRPHPISVQKAELVDSEFHARFSATKRCYEYKIINRRPPLTLDTNRAWCVYKKINVEKMKTESIFFLGKNDLDINYWYLMKMPEGETLLSLFPSPPMHIPYLIIFAVLLFIISFLPYYIFKKLGKRRYSSHYKF